VAIPPFTISHGCVETSFRKLASHELRWSRTVRAVDPAGHLGSALSHPFALALLAAALMGFSARSVGLATAALLSRLILKLWTDHFLRRINLRDVWLLPVCDLMQFGIYVWSFFSARVTWRGVRFDVSSEGLLSSVENRDRGARFWLIRP
jgi:ceramide glucosyltransferase